MMLPRERGSIAIESLPVLALLALFTAGILLASYLFFARAWIQYHSEQALYCAAEGTPAAICKMQLDAKLSSLLPWGESRTRVQSGNDQWSVEVKWNYGDYGFHSSRQLSPGQILRAKALQW